VCFIFCGLYLGFIPRVPGSVAYVMLELYACLLPAPSELGGDAMQGLLVAYLCVFMDQLMQNYQIMSWHVRGLNSSSRQEDVKQVVNTYKPYLICL
jgi:hypothetical protein